MASFNEKHEASVVKREQILAQLKERHFDILIVGGGATGAGAALDSASRGLKTALIEAQDFSFGTSSRSTKLVHGGVRYLENAVKHLDGHEYALVRDALQERQRFLNNAPHLSKPLALLTPVYSWWDAFYFWVGLKCYDLIARKASLGSSEFISKNKALARFPMLKKAGLKGAVLYFDGQFDDARMNLSLILSAIQEGATAANYVRVLDLIKKDGQIAGALVKDELSSEHFKISASVVINATGPFADSIRKMADPKLAPLMVTSQGSHVLLPKSFSPPDSGLVIPKTKDGRVIFLLPWEGRCLAGTTDQRGPLSELPTASKEEVNYILEHVRFYVDVPLKPSDVAGSFSGLRPLAQLSPQNSSTAAMSRDHLIEVSAQKLITIVGGKWTTYRKMGEEAVDCAIKSGKLAPLRASKTKDLKLWGAHSYKSSLGDELAHHSHLAPDIARHLAHAYGDKAFDVLDIAKGELRERLVEGFPYIKAEVIYGLRNEYAHHASDILARRLRLAFLSNEASFRALPLVIDLMALELNWDQAKKDAEFHKAQAFLGTMVTKN